MHFLVIWDLGWNPQRVTEKGSIGRAGKAWNTLPTPRKGGAAQGTREDMGCLQGPAAHKRRDRKSKLQKEKGFPTIHMLASKSRKACSTRKIL